MSSPVSSPVSGSDVVGPYTGGVVRPDEADRLVVAMPQSGDRAVRPRYLAAYDWPPAAYYRYRQRTEDGDHTGLVCDVRLSAFADGRVRGHEEVQPGRVAALVAHLDDDPGGIELVTTLHAAGPRYVEATSGEAGVPLVEVTTGDGVRHTVWRLDPAPGLGAELSGVRHYLADGHHRVAASLARWERAGRPAGARLAVVVHALDGLTLEPHRQPRGGADHPVAALSLAEVLALADAGRTVPPKTTWFRPKPASGLFVGR